MARSTGRTRFARLRSVAPVGVSRLPVQSQTFRALRSKDHWAQEDFSATARGRPDDYCATWVETEDTDPDHHMTTVNAISPSQVLQDDDRSIMMGEAAEAWFRAVAGT